MPFPEKIRIREVEAAYECEICREPIGNDGYVEVHSITSLHLVKSENNKSTKYLVTDTPKGHESLKGKKIEIGIHEEGLVRGSDAVCLCPVCHDEIKRIALAESRRTNPNFSGNTPPPAILKEVTTFFVKRGRPIANYEVI